MHETQIRHCEALSAAAIQAGGKTGLLRQRLAMTTLRFAQRSLSGGVVMQDWYVVSLNRNFSSYLSPPNIFA